MVVPPDKPTIEWQICDDEQKWHTARAAAAPTALSHPVHRTAWSRRRIGWLCAALLALLLPRTFVGYRALRQAGEAMDWIEHEVAAVAEERTNLRTDPHTMEVANTTPGTEPDSGRESSDGGRLEARKVEVRGDYAMVEVWTYETNIAWLPAPYRQTRFFRQTAQGWQITQPPDLFYQPLDTLQVGRFTFVYGPRDASTVLAAAGRVEALDAKLLTELGLPSTDAPLTIKLVTTLFSPLDPVDLTRMSSSAVLNAPSPALLLLPAEITEGEALLQLVAGLLIHYNLHLLLGNSSQTCAWQNVTNGLRLWLLDEHSELPSQSGHIIEGSYKKWQAHAALPRLAWSSPNRDACALISYEYSSAGSFTYDGAAIAFVDYAVHAYGRDHLPALIAGMKHYNSWETLIPAVYGVSAADFVAGWQAFLQEKK